MPVRSGEGGESTEIKIENRTDISLEYLWVNGRSNRSYGIIAPGESVTQHTFAGHTWIIRSGDKTLGCFEGRVDDHVVIDPWVLGNVRLVKGTSRPLRRPKSNRSRDFDAFVRDHNLWIRAKSDGKETPVTTDANAKDSFEGRRDFQWSPDGKFLVAMQTKQVDTRRVTYIESSPKNQLQPKVKSYPYAKPGDELETKQVRLFSMKTKAEVPVPDELFSNPYRIRFVDWSESSDRFWIHYNQRGHQVIRVLEIKVDGSVRPIIEEKSDTFLHYSDKAKSVFEDLPNNEILWASERSGWNHLYRIERITGDVLNAVTSGKWNLKRVVKIDRESQTILFFAIGVRPNQDPYHEHLCRVNFDGSDFRILTEGDGTHSFSPTGDGEHFIDTYSRVDLAPISELRNLETGVLVCELKKSDTKSSFGERRLTERFVAKGRDGKTDIWGIIHWPKNFEATKKYPVVENIYAGPQDFHVPKSFQKRYRHQHRIADAGMIVVQIDGMGTAWRSKVFHDVCFKNLRDSGFPDRIQWIKAAVKKFPQMDISRVGIYGGSAGGQSAMAALLWHNDFYKVAVADCGCHDNRMDKIWWNEQWMGWPVDDSYKQNSNTENAHLLKGDLMLTVGELDENVDPASTTQVVNQLIRHDKDFEFVLITGRGHGAGETPWAAKKRLNFLKRHLDVE